MTEIQTWPFGVKTHDARFSEASAEPYSLRWIELRANCTPEQAKESYALAREWCYRRGAAEVLAWFRDYRMGAVPNSGDPFAPSPYREGNCGMLKNGWLSMIIHYRAVQDAQGRV